MLGGFEVLVDPSGEGSRLNSNPSLVLSNSLSDKILFLRVGVFLTHLKPRPVINNPLLTLALPMRYFQK